MEAAVHAEQACAGHGRRPVGALGHVACPPQCSVGLVVVAESNVVGCQIAKRPTDVEEGIIAAATSGGRARRLVQRGRERVVGAGMVALQVQCDALQIEQRRTKASVRRAFERAERLLRSGSRDPEAALSQCRNVLDAP